MCKKIHEVDKFIIAYIPNQTINDREGIFAKMLSLRATGYGFRWINMGDLAAAEALSAVVSGFRLPANSPAKQVQHFGRNRAADRNPPPPKGHDKHIKLSYLLDQLLGQCAPSGHDMRMVIGGMSVRFRSSEIRRPISSRFPYSNHTMRPLLHNPRCIYFYLWHV
jgi:hypothetical protein